MTTVKDRIKLLIDSLTGGSKTKFAAELGWSGQYLNRVINGTSGVGMQPIIAIVKRWPFVSATWLIMGNGDEVEEKTDVRQQ